MLACILKTAGVPPQFGITDSVCIQNYANINLSEVKIVGTRKKASTILLYTWILNDAIVRHTIQRNLLKNNMSTKSRSLISKTCFLLWISLSFFFFYNVFYTAKKRF